MRYMGGKFHLAKWICPILTRLMSETGVNDFVDLFCGACNIVGSMPATGRRLGNDSHADLIALWRAVQCSQATPRPMRCHEDSTIALNKPGARHPTRCEPFAVLDAPTGASILQGTTRMGRSLQPPRLRSNAPRLPGSNSSTSITEKSPCHGRHWSIATSPIRERRSTVDASITPLFGNGQQPSPDAA